MLIIYLFYLDTKVSVLMSSCYTHTFLLIELRAYCVFISNTPLFIWEQGHRFGVYCAAIDSGINEYTKRNLRVV